MLIQQLMLGKWKLTANSWAQHKITTYTHKTSLYINAPTWTQTDQGLRCSFSGTCKTLLPVLVQEGLSYHCQNSGRGDQYYQFCPDRVKELQLRNLHKPVKATCIIYNQQFTGTEGDKPSPCCNRWAQFHSRSLSSWRGYFTAGLSHRFCRFGTLLWASPCKLQLHQSSSSYFTSQIFSSVPEEFLRNLVPVWSRQVVKMTPHTHQNTKHRTSALLSFFYRHVHPGELLQLPTLTHVLSGAFSAETACRHLVTQQIASQQH